MIHISIVFLNSILSLFLVRKTLTVFQQSGYKRKEYYKWVKREKYQCFKRAGFVFITSLITYVLLAICFCNVVGKSVNSFISLIGYFLLVVLSVKNEINKKYKLPLKITKRVIRLLATYFILNFISYCLLCFCFGKILSLIGVEKFFGMGALTFSVMINPLLVILSNDINTPVENAIKKKYKVKSKKILDGYNGIKIGITGSFGKTSVKEILSELLSVKFKTLATEKSFNTPMGISKAVAELKTENYFIAEMGARQTGDIKELADMVKPKIAVLTGIARQHLQTFKTEENILNTKYELFESTSVEKAYFSSDSQGAVKLYDRYKGEKYLAGLKGDFVYADEIKTHGKMTVFKLHIRGENPVYCATSLLGEHNVSNICLAVAVAYNEGVCVKDLIVGISRLKATLHRLELKELDDKIIIDDTFNASEYGVRAGVKVLTSFFGKKTVITPGLIELGDKQYEINFEFGKLLGENVDRVAIIGKYNKGAIENGIKSVNKNTAIEFYGSLPLCMKKITFIKGEVILFENDLPDNYD